MYHKNNNYNCNYNYVDNNVKRFIEKYTFSERLRDCNKIMTKFPDRIPIICEKSPDDFYTPEIDRHKYLVLHDITIGQFMYIIRKRIRISPSDALFFFVGEFYSIVPCHMYMNQIYDQYKSYDGFLYIFIF